MKSGDGEELVVSSSGGVFGLLASRMLAEGRVVYGAVWTEAWHVCYARIGDATGLSHIKKSKYVQSEIDVAVYESVSANLSAGRKVLHSEMGRQVTAHGSYLRERRFRRFALRGDNLPWGALFEGLAAVRRLDGAKARGALVGILIQGERPGLGVLLRAFGVFGWHLMVGSLHGVLVRGVHERFPP